MPVISSPLHPAADRAEPASSRATTAHSGWYDADASSWEPQSEQFEALRASPPRPAVAVGPGRLSPARRTTAARSRLG